MFMLLKYLEAHPRGELYAAPFDVYLSENDVFQPDLVFVKKAKLRVYARTGVSELWLVDPETRVVQVYHLQADARKPAATYTESDAFRSPHFPGLAIRGSQIFKR